MWNICAATVAALSLACAASLTEAADPPTRILPHQEKCTVPLPSDFWNDRDAKSFRKAEEWAWNERICLGKWADMREAPGGNGAGEECEPAVIEEKGEAVPAYRKLRPEFLELILSHEPWVSAPRHPQVGIECALIRGDIYLDDHAIAPSVWFHKGKIDGNISLLEAKFTRTLSLHGSSVIGKLDADRLEVEGSLFLRHGTFSDIDLIASRVANNTEARGTTVTGTLDARYMEVGGSLDLIGSTFADIDLLDAKVASTASLADSTVTGKLDASRIRVGSSLFLRDGTFSDIELLHAKIASSVSLSGSTVTGRLNADRMEIGGSLFLRGGTFADIDLLDAKVASTASLADSTVTGKLNADRMEIGGSLFLRGGTFVDIDLQRTKIVGAATVDDATINGTLNVQGAEIGGNLFLRRGTLMTIDLIRAKIAGVVQLAGSTFRGEFDLTGSVIGGELLLSSGWQKASPVWQGGASLVLRNVKTNALQARGEDWRLSERDEFLPTDLTGFEFERLEGLDKSGGTSMGDEPADWLIDWIEAQRDHGKNYDPQPYMQLAQVLEAAGATDKAKAIRYAKFEHKREHDRPMSDVRHMLLTLERYFVGYGVYPFVAVYWFIGIVALGGVLAQYSKDSSVRRWTGLWYSLENALPLIETNRRFRKVEHGRPWLGHFFHFQKAFGFMLATILVGALTLLSG